MIGRDGKKLGTVAAVYYDNHTDELEWVGVRTGPAQQAVESVKSTAQHAMDIGADKGGSATQDVQSCAQDPRAPSRATPAATADATAPPTRMSP